MLSLELTRVRVVLIFAVALLVAGAGTYFFAFSSATPATAINMNADKIAIRGYDTVAYFTDGEPTKGKGEFEHSWQGARWHFASATNRDMFAANPERYAPRYGGYCSMGLAIGEYSDADPERWTIIDGNLYLNKDERVQKIWRQGPEAYIVASEVNWKKYRDELRINENLR